MPKPRKSDFITSDDLAYAAEHELAFVVPPSWLKRYTLAQIQDALPGVVCVEAPEQPARG